MAEKRVPTALSLAHYLVGSHNDIVADYRMDVGR